MLSAPCFCHALSPLQGLLDVPLTTLRTEHDSVSVNVTDYLKIKSDSYCIFMAYQKSLISYPILNKALILSYSEYCEFYIK